MYRPLIAITMGDPAGVGPETIAAAWRSSEFHQDCRPIVLGHPEVIQRALDLRKFDRGTPLPRLLEITADDLPPDHRNEAGNSHAHPTWFDCPDVLPCLPCVSDEAVQVPAGQVHPAAGQAALDALHMAVQLAKAGKVNAITTSPLNKASIALAGCDQPGHTELLAQWCGVEHVAMMLYLPPGARIHSPAGLGVVHCTLHCALRDVFAQLTPSRIERAGQLAHVVMKALLAERAKMESGSSPGQSLDRTSGDTLATDDERPRIAVAALNPHAGEGGLFGDEELTTIQPAVANLVGRGIKAVGPIACDTLMGRAAQGEFDAVVAMYHDQGHIALKLLDMHGAVNITLGLPIVRTSVAHGTAFDLAWQGKAESRGLVQAVRVAGQLVRQQYQLSWVDT